MENVLVGTLTAGETLSGVLMPADSGDFTADYATDEECVDVIHQAISNMLKGE